MQRSHFLPWLGLLVAVFSFQCLESKSKDCHTTLTCVEDLPALQPDCRWHYPDGTLWEGGPHLSTQGRWLWPDGRETLTQNLECPQVLLDAGLGDGGLGTDDCPRVPCDGSLICEPETGRCVQCMEDAACAGVTDPNRGKLERCDDRRHECVACLGDDDCGAGLSCKVDINNAANNRCVDCFKQDADQCPPNEVCDTAANKCTTQCTGGNQCRPPKSLCSNAIDGGESGLCVQCLQNMDCSGNTPQCNTARKECVECVDTCPGGQVCNGANRCVQCVDDGQCSSNSDAPHCDPVSNKCVPCLTSAQCAGRSASKCNAVSHVCEACTDDNQCEPDAPVCTGGRCVACRDGSTCTTPAAPLCDTATGSCVVCLGNSNCADPAFPRCDTTLDKCDFCTNANQCTGRFANRNICNIVSGACVQCTTNNNCLNANASRCDQNTGSCARCGGDGDCSLLPGTLACTGGNNAHCVECVNGSHCTTNPKGTACNPATNTCVQCVVDADCPTAAAAHCQNNLCVACTDDAQCGHIRSGGTTLGVCDTAGGGACVQCTGAKRTACGQNVCNGLTKACSVFPPASAVVCGDCVSDAQCAAGDRCALETFEGASLGYSCFHVQQGGGCTVQGYVSPARVTTIDGAAADICLPRLSTCTAFNQYGILPCTSDPDECGEPNADDGLCNTTFGRCTVPCTTPLDCPNAVACGSGACALL